MLTISWVVGSGNRSLNLWRLMTFASVAGLGTHLLKFIVNSLPSTVLMTDLVFSSTVLFKTAHLNYTLYRAMCCRSSCVYQPCVGRVVLKNWPSCPITDLWPTRPKISGNICWPSRPKLAELDYWQFFVGRVVRRAFNINPIHIKPMISSEFIPSAYSNISIYFIQY